jgi:hypothetical protein
MSGMLMMMLMTVLMLSIKVHYGINRRVVSLSWDHKVLTVNWRLEMLILSYHTWRAFEDRD